MEKNPSYVVTAARNALAPCFGDGSVAEELCQAVAKGAKNRDRIKNRQGDARLELVIFDTDRIGSYVFDSKRPAVITGGSKILKDLNEMIREKYVQQTIFSGGGEGLLLLPENKGQEACDWIKELYASITKGALSVTTAWLSAQPADFADLGLAEPGFPYAKAVGGTKALLAKLRDRIRAKKERLTHLLPVDGTGERCASCRDRIGTRKNEFRSDEGKLCEPCAVRWAKGKSLIDGTSFEEVVARFQTSGSTAEKQRYLSFVYCDGNGMGEIFAGLRSLYDFRLLSQTVAQLFEYLDQQVRDRAAGYGLSEKDIISLLGGGDEKIWILPASLAIEVCRLLPEWIDRFVGTHRKGVSSPALTVGTGLVICEHKYPVRYMYELACQLQDSAKSCFYQKDAIPVSSIDFAVISDASPLAEDLAASRHLAFASDVPQLRLTCRPYKAKAFASLLKRIQGSGAVARSQLYQLREAAREGPNVFLNHVCYQAARNAATYENWLGHFGVRCSDPDQMRAFFLERSSQDPKWQQTWLGDAVELAPFLEQGGSHA